MEEINDDEYNEWYVEPIDWNELSKDDFINTLKFAYQHPSNDIDYDSTDWCSLFKRYDASDWIVTDDEKKWFKSLPKKITVYRCGTEDGISWTTNRSVARYFQRDSLYYKNKDVDIHEKVIDKSEIRAVLLDMDEDEVILC